MTLTLTSSGQQSPCGAATSQMNVTISNCCTAPAIAGDVEASATNVCVGIPVVLTLTNVTGTASLYYQWMTNNVAILEATNASYTNLSVTVADSGNYVCVVTNACGAVTSSVVVLTVNAAPVVTTVALPAGTYNSAYNYTVSASGGSAPYTFGAAGLPAGLTLDSAGGLISGTPTVVGASNVVITVTSAAGCASSSNLSLTIGPATPALSVVNSPQTYNGSPQAALVNASVSGTVSNVKYDGLGTVPAGAGTYVVTADFVPDDATHYASLTQAAAGDFSINPAAPLIGIVSSAQTVGYQGSVSFTASLPAYALGDVQFRVDGAALGGPAALAGGVAHSDATSSLARGDHTVAAEYAGNANVVGSTNTLVQTVTNHPPVAVNITMGAQSGTPASLKIIGGKYSPTDVDGDTLIVSAIQNPSTHAGTVTTDGTNVTYTAAGSFVGSDTFTYTVSDGFGGTSVATVTVNVTANGAGFNLISGPVNNGDGTATIDYAGIPGYHYALDTAPALDLPITWTPIVTNSAGSDGRISFTFSISTGEGYFRTRYVP